MGRRLLIREGAVFGNFEVVSAGTTSEGSNRMIQVRCLLCGNQKTMWNTAWRIGKGKCDYCSAKVNKFYAKLESQLPILAVYHDRVEVFYDEANLPTDSQGLFKLLNAEKGIPYLPKEQGSARTVPEPDMGYAWHLKVPAHYVDYYCGISDLPPAAAVSADNLLNDLVHTPHDGAFSNLYKGSAQTWPEGTETLAYVYSKDWNTWPKGQPTPEGYVAPPSKTVTPLTKEQMDAHLAKMEAELKQSSFYIAGEIHRLESAIEAARDMPPSPEADQRLAEAIQALKTYRQSLESALPGPETPDPNPTP